MVIQVTVRMMLQGGLTLIPYPLYTSLSPNYTAQQTIRRLGNECMKLALGMSHDRRPWAADVAIARLGK